MQPRPPYSYSAARELAQRFSDPARARGLAPEPSRPASSGQPWSPSPAQPASMEDTGLDADFVVDLILKHLMRRGQPTIAQLSERIALPVTVLEPVLAFMRGERLVEVPRRGELDAQVAYSLTEQGRVRADDAIRRSLYIGPAPVTLDDYVARVARQKVLGHRVTMEALRGALSRTVLRPALLDALGAAMNSARSIFIYGPSGSGKTYLAEHLVDVIGGTIWVPHAIVVDDQVIQVYDPAVHHAVEEEGGQRSLDRNRRPDARWVHTKRPVVRVGGELTLSMLDLDFDPLTRFYKAPAQLKANNGVLILDDLGRQRTPVHELLNRWIVPLDRRVDFLTLHTGTKFLVPFDCTVVFSSNLSPSGLEDPAFVRRLGYKVYVGEMTEDEYRQVFRMACSHAGVAHDRVSEDFLISDLHPLHSMPFYAAYPMDLLMKIVNRAAFEGVEPTLNPDALRWAWKLYFAADEAAVDGDGLTGG